MTLLTEFFLWLALEIQGHPYHIAIEVFLAFVALILILTRPPRPGEGSPQLSASSGSVSAQPSVHGAPLQAPLGSRSIPHAPPQQQDPLNMPCVVLSGFKDQGPSGYSMADKLRCAAAMRTLGAEVKNATGEMLPQGATHIVSPPTARTMKVLAAVLTGKWVVEVEWVNKCEREGFLSRESEFGFQGCSDLLRGRKAFVTDSLRGNQPRFDQIRTLLVTYGKGEVLERREGADLILLRQPELAQWENDEVTGQDVELFTFDTFVQSIYNKAKAAFLDRQEEGEAIGG